MREPDELVKKLSALLGWDVAERDGMLDGLPGRHILIRRQAKISRADIRRWWHEAVEAAAVAEKVPALLYQARGDEWRCVEAMFVAYAYELTAELSLIAWATMMRQLAGHTEAHAVSSRAEVLATAH